MPEMRTVPLATLASGAELNVHIHELRGVEGGGPTVGICAAIHGDEPTGTEIVLALARRLSSREFRGRLLLLPVANPLAFAANRRHTPLDDQNLNRVFPGDRDGWLSEKLARVITEEFLSRVDVLLDLHSGGDRPTVDYVYIRNAEPLSRSFGSPVLYRAAPGRVGTVFAGTSITVTEERGIPSVTVELGGGRIDQTPYVDRGVRGIENVLGTLGVLAKPSPSPPPQTVVRAIHTIRPHAGGFVESEAPLGQPIEAGAVLGRIVSPYTFEELEVMRSPARGIVILSHLTTNVVEPGDYGYMVGEPEP